jgi:hypothetical protein
VASRTANLIDRRDVSVALLNNPLGWRVRVVEEITVDSATSCTRRRSLQVAPLREVLAGLVPRHATHALLALNVAPLPRGPLMDFDVSGPEGEAWLLPRTEIAARQGEYLLGLAMPRGKAPSSSLMAVLTAILGFTGELLVDGQEPGIGLYLRDGLGRPVSAPVLANWADLTARCRAVLRPRLDEFRGHSAPENPILVLPQLFDLGVVATDTEATLLLAEYTDLLERMDREASTSSEPTVADEFLNSLADYANYYDLIVAMRVPLDEPFLVKFSERRDLDLTILNEGEQDLVIADALSNHVSFKVSDPNVRIAEFEAHHPASDTPAYGAFQSRRDEQSRAFYAHDPERDYRIRLRFRLALLRRLQLVPYGVAALLLLLTIALWISWPTTLSTLALIVGPSALAASVLLYRDPTTLGSRLRFWTSLILTVGLFALIATAVILYVSGPNVLDLR